MGIRARNLWCLAIILLPATVGQTREPRANENLDVAVEVYFVDLDTAVVEELKQQGLLRQQDTGKVACILDNAQSHRFMDVVQADVRSNVMQAPKLTMCNGQTGRVNACDHQYFVTSLEIVSRDGHLEFLPKSETVPLGVQLKIRSAVSVDRRVVRTHLRASLTNVASSDVPRIPITTPAPNGGTEMVTHYIEQPQIDKFSVDRKMVIPDGNTAVLMGPIKQCETRVEHEVPILSQIPVVGRRLFRSIGYGRQTHQVLVLVTPRIQVRQETEEKQANKVEAAVLEAIHHCADEEAVGDFRVEEAMLKEAIDRCGGEAADNEFRTPILPPYRGYDPHCSEVPKEGRILRALPPLRRLAGIYEESRDNVQIVTERIADKIDPPRFFPLVGKAQLHHCQWKCSVYYQQTITSSYPFYFRWTQPRTEVVSIDTDHLHICPTNGESGK